MGSLFVLYLVFVFCYSGGSGEVIVGLEKERRKECKVL